MSAGSVARRYAKALMELGVQSGEYKKLGEQFAAFAEATQVSTELAETLSNPGFPRGERKKIIDAVTSRLGSSDTVRKSLYLLVDRERMESVADISRELTLFIQEKDARIPAVVESAVALTPEQQKRLQAALETISGRKVELQMTENPELIGGVVASVGDLIFDGSLRAQLQKLGSHMTEPNG